jgi:hypothetical protein
VPGFNHSPQNDIDNLRDLLKGYGDADSVLKELIQNAEDASARRFELIYLEPDVAGADLHPLLRGPILCAINDGAFLPEHQKAIFNIGSGTKGADDRCIGRFGKGLKGVFALCEAFLFMGSPEATHGWDESVWLMNPFDGWRHPDWEDGFHGESKDRVRDYMWDRLKAYGWEGGSWLSFWFPLRHSSHLMDAKGPVSPIHKWGGSERTLPGEDRKFPTEIGRSFAWLSSRLLLLRNLEQLRFRASLNAPPSEIRFSPECVRSKAPSEHCAEHWIEGDIFGVGHYAFRGVTGRLEDQAFEGLHRREDWPRIIDPSGKEQSIPVKGQPHFGCVFCDASRDRPELNLQWSVFLPVAAQLDAEPLPLDPKVWETNLSLTLHGSFFLDSTRTRIDGLIEGFEQTLKQVQKNGGSANQAPLLWNRRLAEEGPLAHLPRVVADFLETKRASDAQKADLVRALRSSRLWSTYSKAITRDRSYVLHAVAGKNEWSLVESAKAVFYLPIGVGTTVGQLWDLLPSIAGISGEAAVMHLSAEESGLFDESKRQLLPEDLLLRLVEGVALREDNRHHFLAWVRSLKGHYPASPRFSEALARLPLFRVARAKSRNDVHWLTAEEYRSLLDREEIFWGDQNLDHLSRVLADQDLWVDQADYDLRQMLGLPSRSLAPEVAARKILRERAIPSSTALIRPLVKWLADESQRPLVRSALRYLLHRSVEHRNDGSSSLAYPGGDGVAAVWPKLMRHLLASTGAASSWRMLSGDLTSSLSAMVLNALNIRSIDARGCLAELAQNIDQAAALDFDPEEWSDAEIEEILEGLYRTDPHASVPLLRRMRLHRKEGQAKQLRVNIGDEWGELRADVLLQKQGFAELVSAEVRAQWKVLSEEITIIRCVPETSPANTAQRELFKRNLGAEVSVAELTRREVVAHALALPQPDRFDALILEALRVEGSAAMKGLGEKFQSAPVFRSRGGDPFRLSQLCHLEGMEVELAAVFSEDPGFLTLLDLPKALAEDPTFLANRRSITPPPIRVLERVANSLQRSDHWSLGLSDEQLPPDWLDSIKLLQDSPFLPVAGLLVRLRNAVSKGEVDDQRFASLFRPAVARPWPREMIDQRVEVLQRFQADNIRSLHGLYLGQAVEDGVINRILPRLRLLNQRGAWCPASELIWPTDGPPLEHQLDLKQAKILEGKDASSGQGEEIGIAAEILPELDKSALPELTTNTRDLIQYLESFQPVDDYDILVSAFVAVCFDRPELAQFAAERLQPLGKSLRDLRQMLFQGSGAGSSYDLEGNHVWTKGIFIFRFQDSAEAREYTTLTGGRMCIRLNEAVESLIVDSRRLANALGRFQGQVVRELILRRIDQPATLAHLPEIWRRTLRLVVEHGYNLPPTLCPDFSSLEKMLGREFPLRRVQRTLLDSAEMRLKGLRCQNTPPFDHITRLLEDAREARLLGDDYFEQGMTSQGTECQKRASDKRSEAEGILRGIVTAPDPGEPEFALVEATRRKLGEFGYSEDSVLLELFQNADDALSERVGRSGAIESTFDLTWNATYDVLLVTHWGRCINDPLDEPPESPGHRAYTRDLEKMLTLNLSDKLDDSGAANGVTGRFGLGFKSVFFFCDHPLIRSGRLRCQIRGAFFPGKPTAGDLSLLDELASSFASPDAITIFALPDLRLSDERRHQLVDRFKEIAPYLVHCARSVAQIRIRESAQIFTTQRVEGDAAAWSVASVEGRRKLLVVPQRQIANSPAAWIFNLDANGFARRPDSIPAIWATVPTDEPTQVACLVNGDWVPDAGRVRIAHQAPENPEVASMLAQSLTRALSSLVQHSQEDWSAFRQRLGLSSKLETYDFWDSFWRIVTTNSPVLFWRAVVHQGGDLINALLWNHEFGALHPLLRNSAIVPSGLGGPYRGVVVASEVRFRVVGTLGESRQLQAVFDWPEVQDSFPPSQVVEGSVGALLNRARGPVMSPIESLELSDVVGLYANDELEVTSAASARLGSILHRDLWRELTEDEVGHDLAKVRRQLRDFRFPSRSGKHVAAVDLLVAHTVPGVPEIEKDERRRAAFAPADRLLSLDFGREALRFFALCREKIEANAALLAEWARAATEDALTAVFHYFFDGETQGELAQGLADKLGLGWLREKELSAEFTALSREAKEQIWRLFGKVTYLEPEIPVPPPSITFDPHLAFRSIHSWWMENRADELPEYLRSFYGTLAPTQLPWPSDDAWGFGGDAENLRARKEWMILFVHAAMHTQGWFEPGRFRAFVAFLENHRWIEVFADPASTPSDFTGILDEFLENTVGRVTYYHSMRQFITFYAASRNLEATVEGLANLEKKQSPWNLEQAFSLGLEPEFAGSGIDAPSMVSAFGLGEHYILRELYRLGRLTNPLGWEHCFVLNRRTRRLCEWIFGIEGFGDADWKDGASKVLYETLLDLGTEEKATFGGCFDIPLWILAHRPSLQNSLLGEAIIQDLDQDII